jgi:hypothetical protein
MMIKRQSVKANMSVIKRTYILIIAAALLVFGILFIEGTFTGLFASKKSLSGAIFTSTPDGKAVNKNQYDTKHYVYLYTGPDNSSDVAGHIPAGYYVFQVTDPEGEILLSEDPSKCRIIEIGGDGDIVRLVSPGEVNASLSDSYQLVFSPEAPTPCHSNDPLSGRHATGPHPDGGLVVQLMPYLLSPDIEGTHKVWITPLQDYQQRGGELDTNSVDRGIVEGKGFSPDRAFTSSRSKKDTFKVYAENDAPVCKNDPASCMRWNMAISCTSGPGYTHFQG